jgi:DNA-binding transcriptional regulator LsrR (DeoR family)
MAVTQRSINRVLYELKKKGIIEVNNNLITLHDVEALKKEAENGSNE